jgi:hypothetical protein
MNGNRVRDHEAGSSNGDGQMLSASAPRAAASGVAVVLLLRLC